MRTKISSIIIIMMLVVVNFSILFTISVGADESSPQWPSSWNLYDTDGNEGGTKNDFRDVWKAYYAIDANYL